MNPAEEAAYQRGVTETLGMVNTIAAVSPLALMPAGCAVTLEHLAEALATVDPGCLWVLRPFARSEAITVKEAATIAGKSESSVRAWADRYRIGRRVMGSLLISRPALAMALDDDPAALAAYLSGVRSAPVAAYLERA